MQTPEIIHNAELGGLSSFRLPARAAELVVLETADQIAALPAESQDELMLGGGSNTVFLNHWRGRILLNRIAGVRFETDGEDVRVTAGAGENWHRLVRHCMSEGLHGLENLIMIPGSVGAAPMQNVGAYGVELAEVLEHLDAWDRQNGEHVRLERTECAFGYRDSRFKSTDRDRFLITSVTLRLSRRFQARTAYASLSEELERVGTRRPGARQLAAAVMRLRRHRLPDPARLANAGSFFKNPVVDTMAARSLLAAHPGLPYWPMPDGKVKLGAGAMIEQLGWKGKFIGDAGVYPNHALVLVNRGRATAGDLRRLIEAITGSVEREFGVRLEPEPLLVGD